MHALEQPDLFGGAPVVIPRRRRARKRAPVARIPKMDHAAGAALADAGKAAALDAAGIA